MKKLVMILLIISLAACEKELMEADALGENAGIVGTWVETVNQDDVLHLDRRDEFDPSRYGFAIGKDGSFVENKNSGWCATPPIAYSEFEGKWEAVSDSLLEITVGYWGGVMTYQMRIVSLEGNELAVRFLYAADRMDAR